MKRLLLVAAILALGACSCGAGAGVGGSGVQGVVLAGPQCPVQRAGSPCPDEPFAGTVRATRDDGKSAEVKTDEQGRFRLALEPGTYVLTLVSTGGPPTAKPTTVEVVTGAFAQATIQVDTGIR